MIDCFHTTQELIFLEKIWISVFVKKIFAYARITNGCRIFPILNCCFLLLAGLISSTFASSSEKFEKKEWPESHITLLAPKDWNIFFEKTDDFPIFHLSPEPLNDEFSNSYEVGLAINILRAVPSVMGQLPSEYVAHLITQIRERSDKEIQVQAGESPPFKFYRVEYSLLAEKEVMNIVNILQANDATGTLYMIVWQAPQSKTPLFSEVREKTLRSIRLDPAF